MRERLKKLLGLYRPIPRLIVGYDIRRWEQRGGGAVDVPEFKKKLLFLDGFAMPALTGIEQYDNGNMTFIWDTIPLGPTHLQYDSPFGFLITWPFCFHVWIRFKGQDKYIDDNGVEMTKPGTEKVFYWRFGVGRWDAHDDKYITPTWYGPGLHWD